MLAKLQTLAFKPNRQLWRLSYGESIIETYWTIDAFNQLAMLRHTDNPTDLDTQQAMLCMKAAMETRTKLVQTMVANSVPHPR